MADEVIETLRIKVKYDGDNATKKLNELTQSVKMLNQVAKNKSITSLFKELTFASDFGLKDTNKQVTKLVKGLKELQSVNKIKVKVNSNFGTLPKETVSSKIPVNDDKITPRYGSLNGITDISAFKEATSGLLAINNVMQPSIANMNNYKNSVYSVSEALQNMNRPLSGEIQSNLERMKTSIKDVSKESEKGSSKLSKFMSSVKRIIMYRTIRRALQIIANAIKEGIQNIALFDNNFNDSMSQIKSTSQYLKNSLGSALAPVIESLTPSIVALGDAVANVSNKFGEMFAAINGNDTFTKAIKTNEDYAKSLKNTNNLLGVDEINKSNTTNKGFETAKVSKELNGIGRIFKSIKETIGKIVEQIEKLASKLAPILLSIVESLLPLIEAILNCIVAIIEPLTPLIVEIVDALAPVINIISKILADVVEMITPFLPPVVNLVGLIVQDLKPALEFISTIVSAIWSVVEPITTTLFNFNSGALGFIVDSVKLILSPIIDIKNHIADIVKNITSKISPFMDSLVDKLQPFSNKLNEIKDSVKDWLSNSLPTIFENVWNKIVGWIESALSWVKEFFNSIGDFFGKIGNGIKNGISSIGDWFSDIGSSIASGVSGAWNTITGRATGGFVNNASLFYANENGVPELVGQIGNQTAVANTEQIIEGIKRGVMEAMLATNANGGDIILQVYKDDMIDSEKIIDSAQRRNRRDGKSTIMLGTI